MSLEQYKDAGRKELWEILQIQMQVLQSEVAKNAELECQLAEIEKERDMQKMENMAAGLKASIDLWHQNTSNKMQGHIEYGVLGKRPIDDPDSIPVEILKRDMGAFILQAKSLKESKT
jgi:hypothetical protein